MSDEPRAVLLIVSAAERSEAERIGEALVERRLAASGSVVPGLRSFFRDDNGIQREHGALLLVRTSADRSASAQAELKALHSNPNPDILEVTVTGGSPTYLDWLFNEVRLH